jgi:uncharacterized protein YdcH (DUF465 family)
MSLKFDGSHLGDITKDILETSIEGKEKICLLKYKENTVKVRVFTYKHIIGIINEIKKLFNIPIYPNLRCIIEDKECFIVKKEEDVQCIKSLNYKELISNQSFITELRRLFIFKHLMCLTCNNESRIEIKIKKLKTLIQDNTKIYIPLSYKESCFKALSDTRSCSLPKTIIERWFENNDELVYDMTIDILKSIDIHKFKVALKDEVQKYIQKERQSLSSEDAKFTSKLKDIESLIWWSNAVLEKIRIYPI